MRLLVVEVEGRTRTLLRRGLIEEGYVVDVASDVRDGVAMATTVHYDAVICDAALPALDGLEVCRQLRGSGRRHPILLLTEGDGAADRVKGLDAGANDCLSEPFSFIELAARLRSLLRRGDVERHSALSVGDLVVDTKTKTVTRAGVDVAISAREFALLELFARHPNEVLTRSQILEQAWHIAFEPASNVVDQYVGYLRRKIDRRFARNDLQTVRGAGYRLRASHGPSTDASEEGRQHDRASISAPSRASAG